MAAASAASLYATLSSLSLNRHRRNPSPFSSLHLPSTTSKIPPLLTKPLQKLPPPKANSSDLDTTFFDNANPEEISTFSPPEVPEGFIPPPSFDEEPLESDEEIARAYEELYGPAYSGESFLGNDIYVMDPKVRKTTGIGSKTKREKVRDGLEEEVIQVRRVTKVVKGGRQLNFRAVVVVGDKQGHVGVGVGKAAEMAAAVQKSAINARRNIVSVPITRNKTFPHRSEAKYGAAKVMLRPSSPGSGVVAGGAVRVVLELAGFEAARGKQLGSNNTLNNARATVAALQMMRRFREVAEERGIPVEELWK